MKVDVDVPPAEDPEAKLERALIEEYLRERGHTLRDVDALAEESRLDLLRRASTYAAGRLAEIEARARYVKAIHPEQH